MSIQEKISPLSALAARQRGPRGAITALLSCLRPRERFFLLLIPRILVGRYTALRAAGYAFALTRNGNHRLGKWCWERAIRVAQDEETCHRTVELCLKTGDHGAAVALANRYYDENGMLPAAAVRLIGMLVMCECFDAALKTYDRLLRQCGGDLAGRWPAPAWSQPLCSDEIRSMLVGHQGDAAPERTMEIHLSMGRLCFSFGVFDISAKLFERAGDHAVFDVEDSIAFAYSLLRSNQSSRLPRDIEDIGFSAVPEDVDWQALLATALFARGRVDMALALVEKTVRSRFSDHKDIEGIVADCREVVCCIGCCRDTLTFDPGTADGFCVNDHSGLRKIFICGNGWSGSGALYDALTEYDGFAEAPDTPIDRYVNPCTGNEMMLVQGTAGIGMIWRQAREDRVLTKLDLWELFRCHLLAGGAIGFTEHKSAKTALDLLARLGSRYTNMFRRLFESLAALPMVAPLEQLRSYLITTTEAFTVALADGHNSPCVPFNNAVFGYNIDMLEIFSNFKAAVVARDPLDQFVDRRNQDLKHWMTARRFVSVYRASREAFQARRMQLKPERAADVREVEFERIVLEEPHRQDILDWLLENRSARRVRCRFEPQLSAANIGIHAGSLSDQERRVMERELKQWRRS